VTDSLWNVIGDLSSATAQDIGIDYPNSEIDILDHKGSSTSVKTYNAGIQIGDVRITQNYPKANKVLVYGKSEGETRIVSNYPTYGRDASSQSTYGVITLTIRDPKITTQAQANILADAEVARLKDPIKVYDFDIFNPNQSLVSGDVVTINALSQGVSNEDVRIVAIERGVNRGEEYLTLQVVNETYSRLTKTSDYLMAQIEKNFREQQTYDGYSDEYSNQNINTNIAQDISFYLTEDIIPALTADFNGFSIRGIPALRGTGSGPANYINIDSSLDLQNSQKIVQLPNPSFAQDAATKAYVDGAIGKVWAASGTDFIALNSSTEYATYSVTTGNANTATLFGTAYVCPVHLPNGATITGVVVYGNSTSENWALRKGTHQSATISSIATATIETEDTSISGNPVNNSTNYYFLTTDVMDQNDKIEGARITYTL